MRKPFANIFYKHWAKAYKTIFVYTINKKLSFGGLPMGNVLITADSTCDLGETFREHYQLRYFPYHIILDNKEYSDGVDITPDDLYRAYREKKILPKTAAIGIAEYTDFFRPFVEQGFEIVHFCLGSSLSSTYQNCCIAAEDLGHVYPVDSRSFDKSLQFVNRTLVWPAPEIGVKNFRYFVHSNVRNVGLSKIMDFSIHCTAIVS